jgi:hypothetical protein
MRQIKINLTQPVGLVRRVATAAALLVAVWSIGMPATAQAPSLALLDSLIKGQWDVRYRGSSEVKRICVRTGRELIQLRHPGADCKRFVVEDSAAQVAVQYTCPGNGYGRTNIRRETSSLVQIEGNGTSNAGPFQFMAEARHTGSCTR